jgi:hypothetical protein
MLNKRNYTWYLLLLIALVYVLFEAAGKGDFFIFLSASDDLFEGENIYTNMYLDGYHYLYSILFAILIKPLTFLPLYLSKVLWLILNLFFIYRIGRIIYSYLDPQGLSQKKLHAVIVLSFVFALRFICDNFHLAQMTIFMLYLSLEGIQLIRNDKKTAGAALIALGINIKLLPIVLLPYLLWRKELKAFAWCLVFYAVFMFLPVIVIGYDQTVVLVKEWWKIINPTQEQNMIDVSERSFHSLSTLIPTLLMEKVPDIYAMDLKRNIMDLPVEKVNPVINLVRLLLVGFTLYFLRSNMLRTFGTKQKTFWELSYILLLIPLIFPHQQHYAFLFSLPAGAYLLHYLFVKWNSMKKPERTSLISLLIVIYLCFNLNLLIGEFKHYYEHYKIITWGALLMIPLLAVCKPAEESGKAGDLQQR